jgi:hypothetical protein
MSRAFSIAMTACAAKFWSDLLFGERTNLVAIDRKDTQQSAIFSEWDGEKRSDTTKIDQGIW